MNPKQILHLLTQEYTLILAASQNDIKNVREIREEVFTAKYNKPIEFLDSIGVLFDKDDQQSFIYLLRHNASNKYVGTVRVFFMNQNTPSQNLPMQQTVKTKNIKPLLEKLPVVEISRGALIRELPQHESFSELQLRTLLTYGLMVTTRINFFLYSSTRVFSIMENALYRILKRQNVNFEQIADSVDSYGTKRTPFSIKRTKLLEDTENNMGDITRFYLKELCQNPDKFWEFIDNNPYLERSDIQLDRICKLFKEYGDDVDISLLLGESAPEKVERTV